MSNKKNKSLKFSFWSIPQGFTLIELIVVFSIMTILTTTGIASFVAYNTAQIFRNAAADIQGVLFTAKSHSLSQLKPDQCLNQVLEGYQVVFSIPGQAYALDAVCSGNTYTLDTRSLPAQVSFQSGTSSKFFFSVSQGSVASPGSVTIHGMGKSSTISVDAAGNISVN